MTLSIDQTEKATGATAALAPTDTFARRHIGPTAAEHAKMLAVIGAASLEELTAQTVPAAIRRKGAMNLPDPQSESEALADLKAIAQQNKIFKSFIGMGYYGTITPGVILRNILENPNWYTQYTPYQAEISQGRLEALLNFQTMISDLTGLPLANASLLDEGTAAAEAMSMCRSIAGDESERDTFFISDNCHPQTIAVVQARAAAQGIKTIVGDESLLFNDSLALNVQPKHLCGILLQYPGTDGRIEDYATLCERSHDDGIMIVCACDLLALTLIKPPGEWGADIAVGSAQRFGVPMGFGGPHAAFMATKQDYARKMPGRIVGVSRDAHGNPAMRLALQTREQHIRREKATSNICTAQVLLAIMASMYAVYHGPEGLKAIARRVHNIARLFSEMLAGGGLKVASDSFFDTVCVVLPAHTNAARVAALLVDELEVNARTLDANTLAFSFDETSSTNDAESLADFLLKHAHEKQASKSQDKELEQYGIVVSGTVESWQVRLNHFDSGTGFSEVLQRRSPFLTHPVFNRYHSEHEMLRYITRLQSRDLSLTTSNIPLGSCTMKLNATTEMIPVTWPEFGNIHPFAPADQTRGYQEMFNRLEAWLSECTGFAATSLQPNAGSAGEYAGLLVIRAYHESRNEGHRNICLIPTSAHGTNPASAVVAGFHVVPVACDAEGNVDLADLKKKAEANAKNLACVMVTYPSTHGVFEEGIKEICQIVHAHGGQVYMDGANMNAQVGLTAPGIIGADVCHLNLHKTFCIPHGGGGPGMGPICVAKHLAPFLPGHPVTGLGGKQAIGAISAAPYGSASILPISYLYIAMMGAEGLTQATQVAILNANYMAKRLEEHYPVLFRGKNGRCAHEFILDCRAFEDSAGIKVEDIAKRLMDYGFHAPTMSWPVPGTLMFEPTESESLYELDRLCDAMIRIRQEIRDIEEGRSDRADNPLKHAPHTARAVTADKWDHKYSREVAAYPAPWTVEHKFWPYVGRIDNPYGDRNLVCTCPPMEACAVSS